jgi:hypothetical protein
LTDFQKYAPRSPLRIARVTMANPEDGAVGDGVGGLDVGAAVGDQPARGLLDGGDAVGGGGEALDAAAQAGLERGLL